MSNTKQDRAMEADKIGVPKSRIKDTVRSVGHGWDAVERKVASK